MKTQDLATSAFRPIPPELVARKVAAINNYEHPELLKQINGEPRLIELLVFLQAMSMRKGGLAKFSADLIEQQPQRLGTPTMRAAGAGSYSLEQKRAIWGEFPEGCHPPGAPIIHTFLEMDQERRADFYATEDDLASSRRAAREESEEFDKWLRQLNRGQLIESCRQAAIQSLPSYFISLCTDPEAQFAGKRYSGNDKPLWVMDDPIAAVFEMMDGVATQAAATVADTIITQKVFAALDRALELQVMQVIRGNSRFGKTEALKAGCASRPGRLRMVTVQRGNSIRDLLNSICEAIGIDSSSSISTAKLLEKIRYVLKHLRLVLAFDEGAFLVPETFTKTTPPKRMNFVRTELYDRGLSLVIAVTPQWYDQGKDSALKKYEATTKFAIEQFTGRCVNETLPDSLEESDVLKVCRFYFPEIRKQENLRKIGHCAAKSPNFLQSVKDISEHSRLILRSGKLDAVGTEARLVKAVSMAIAQLGLKRNAGTDEEVQEPLIASARALQPAGMPGDLAVRSLRGAGLVQERSELVSANS